MSFLNNYLYKALKSRIQVAVTLQNIQHKNNKYEIARLMRNLKSEHRRTSNFNDINNESD